MLLSLYILLILDNYLEKRDFDKHREKKIKLIADNRKKYIIVLIYYIL